MKNHRRHLLWKRSQLLAQSRRWTTGFGELGKYCFQKQSFLAKKKRQSAQLIVSLNHNKLYRRLQCRRKALELQSRWAPDVPLNAETYQKPTVEPYAFLTKLLRAKRFCPYRKAESPSGEAVRKLNKECFQSEDPSNSPEFETVAVINSISSNIHYVSCGTLDGAALPVKKGGFVYSGEESNNGEGNTVLVVLNNYKRKCCCKGSGMELVTP